MNNEQREREFYRYPGSDVLRNKLNIRDSHDLSLAERRLVGFRREENIPRGDFDLKHIQSIHKHLFQDIYHWAGEIRKVDFHKNGNLFIPVNKIRFGMQDVHKRVLAKNYLKNLDQSNFSKEAGKIIGDVNYVHPFREGNGRTQFEYLKQLSKKAGHPVDLKKLDRSEWIHASIKSHNGGYDHISSCINRAILKSQSLEVTKEQRFKALKSRLKQESLTPHFVTNKKTR